MRERMTKPGWLLVGCTLAMLSLATLPAQAADEIVAGITGTGFDLSVGTAHISTPDGDSLQIWGYGDDNGLNRPQYPGPTLIVNQGATVTIVLTNNLPHQATSMVFPGHENVTASASGCPDPSGLSCGLLTAEAAPNGGTATYTFEATHPGTYMYHSGTNTELQLEMGLFGAIIVRPTGFDQASDTNRKAYEHPDTDYVAEYLLLFSEMDPTVHYKAELGLFDQIDMSEYNPLLWFVNGRNAPDTLAPRSIPWMPHQPYNALPAIHPGDKLLMRVVGASHNLHPWHTHGNNFNILAQDGRLLTSNPADANIGPDLSSSGNTLPAAPLKTYDATWDWTGMELGWDIYGTPAEGGLAHTCTPALGSGSDFDEFTHEYCPDHGKPLPVILPEFQDLAFGGFWSGSPFLSSYGDLPPGEGGLNIGGGLYHIWHSHTEKELVNNDVFPGGMLTFCIVLPHSEPLP